MNILFFGDVVGRPGRLALAQAVPALRKEFDADLVIANVENMAHGYGITPETIAELEGYGVNLFTSGNHIWKNAQGTQLLSQEAPENIARPANVSGSFPGRDHVVTTVNGKTVVVINLLGRVFMDIDSSSPFDIFDTLYKQYGDNAIVLVDFHAEATGEKRIMSWHVDGRASLLVGTHTHVQTSDEQILPNGTGYITDLGFCGARYSSLGMEIERVKAKVIEEVPTHLEPPNNPAEVVARGVAVSIDEQTGVVSKILRIDRIFSV